MARSGSKEPRNCDWEKSDDGSVPAAASPLAGKRRQAQWLSQEAPMKPLGALVVRELRLALRLGGGAPIGVLFFLIVVALVPFALAPILRSCGESVPPSCGSARC